LDFIHIPTDYCSLVAGAVRPAADRLRVEVVRASGGPRRERARADQAEAAERIARDEAAGLRAELDARRQWRLRWALGRKR
jgi:hypothetical protein